MALTSEAPILGLVEIMPKQSVELMGIHETDDSQLTTHTYTHTGFA